VDAHAEGALRRCNERWLATVPPPEMVRALGDLLERHADLVVTDSVWQRVLSLLEVNPADQEQGGAGKQGAEEGEGGRRPEAPPVSIGAVARRRSEPDRRPRNSAGTFRVNLQGQYPRADHGIDRGSVVVRRVLTPNIIDA
jgi:hypothetical protein